MKKLYVACDMEGTTGNCNWDEVNQKSSVYSQFQEIMTNEVLKVCEIMSREYDEICVKDGHWTETNILIKDLPENCKIIRGDDGRNLTGLDSSYSAVMLIGYHAAGGEFKYPLSHTISDDIVYEVRLNGKRIGETTLAIINASIYNVPTIFILGDESAVKEAQNIFPEINNVITKNLSNTSYISKSPKKVMNEIEISLKEMKENNIFENNKNVYLPKVNSLEIEYTNYRLAKKYSNYPNAKLNGRIVSFEVKDIDEFLRIINLCI